MSTVVITRRSLLVGLLAAAACTGRSPPTAYQTELTAPWTAMALPVDGGRVVYSDEAMLNVHFDGGEVGAQTARWTEALSAAGLKKGSDTSAEDMTSITWSNDDAVVALGVLSRDGRAEVSLTRYPRSP